MKFFRILNTFHFGSQPGAELICFGAQSIIAENFKFCLECIDLRHDLGRFFNFAFIGVAPEDFDKFLEHE